MRIQKRRRWGRATSLIPRSGFRSLRNSSQSTSGPRGPSGERRPAPRNRRSPPGGRQPTERMPSSARRRDRRAARWCLRLRTPSRTSARDRPPGSRSSRLARPAWSRPASRSRDLCQAYRAASLSTRFTGDFALDDLDHLTSCLVLRGLDRLQGASL